MLSEVAGNIALRHPELKVSIPAHTKHLGWYVEFEVPGDAPQIGVSSTSSSKSWRRQT